MARRLWVAMDVSNREQSERVLGAIAPHRHIKVGIELFYRMGPEYVVELVDRGYHVFLDLKCHDIPRTVGRAAAAARDLGVELLTVHAAGGLAMLNAAQESAGMMDVVAVTMLTSLSADDLSTLGIQGSVIHLVHRGAENARRAGLAGVVVSGREVSAIKRFWPDCRLVVPGIRLLGDAPGDQARVDTPARAVSAGATDLVVGRAVVESSDPARALAHYLNDMEAGRV